MYTNTEATLYAFDGTGYTRVPLGRVFWDEVQRVNAERTGMTTGDAATILVPYVSPSPPLCRDGKSRIVKGAIDKEITDAYTITQLVKDYDALLITAVDTKHDGNPCMWHWEVGAK